jgi:hypothetical protein
MVDTFTGHLEAKDIFKKTAKVSTIPIPYLVISIANTTVDTIIKYCATDTIPRAFQGGNP